MSDGINRRFFLKLLGATGAAAGCSPSHAPEKLIPLLNPPENMVPGKPLFYRTACRACAAGCGVTARTREGRVVKLEGNPDDPISAGALCARGQAELQTLYSPTRLRGPLVRRGTALVPLEWPEAMRLLTEALTKLRADPRGVAGLRLLSRCEPGSAGAVQRAFLQGLGAKADQRVVFEPRDLAPLRAANAALFGAAELPVIDLARARSVVSFGADFLETWLSPVELARSFMRGRGAADRARLTWIGPRLPMTGANADTWLRVRPGGELTVAVSLLRWLLDPANGVRGLAAQSAAILAALPRADAADAGVSMQDIAKLGRELASHRPSALLGPGVLSSGLSPGSGATALAAVVQLTNYALGNLGGIGSPVQLGLGSEEDAPSPPADTLALFEQARRGEITALIAHRANPAGSFPDGAAEALGRIPLIVHFGEQLDETAQLAHFVLPDRHALESFGDVSPRRGVVQLQQPAMTPLWDTKPASQVLLDLAAALALPGVTDRDYRELVRTRSFAAARALGAAQLDATQAQRDLLARGSVSAKVAPLPRPLRLDAIPRVLAAQPARAQPELSLVSFPTTLAAADPSAPGWLREIPDALTGVSWSSWAEISPATAKRLGVGAGEWLSLRTSAGTAELPAVINPALHDSAVAVPHDAPELRALASESPAVQVGRTGRISLLPVTGHASQEGRGLARAVTDGERAKEHQREYEHESGHGPEHGHGHEKGHAPEHERGGSLVPPHEHPVHRWAMSIDLDSCTGCQACVVACYAENNLPVVGPQAAREGRNMAWLRIQRSFEPDGSAGPGSEGRATGRREDVRIAVLPSLCQHCDAAPCEPVCPTYATYHTAEGLNAQVYNRCIGTRYCANNCPYDARVFNWMDHVFEEPLQMQLNPDVSVRTKGVMEKCTFCVQRIRLASHTAKNERRPVREGDVTPACVQTCPAQALTFGDSKEVAQRVSVLQRDERAYRLLEEVNTLPAIAYLARRTRGDE